MTKGAPVSPTEPQQYFERHPASAPGPRQVVAELRGMRFVFHTAAGIFSPDRVDRGTQLLVKHMELPATGEVLDWGAGYGVIGIVAARLHPDCRVLLAEVNERAADLARRNLQVNGITNARVAAGDAFALLPDLTFDVILTNPPIRAGKAVVLRLIEESALSVRPGGSFWLVGRRKQGVLSLRDHMAERFARVDTVAVKSGYRVLRATQP